MAKIFNLAIALTLLLSVVGCQTSEISTSTIANKSQPTVSIDSFGKLKVRSNQIRLHD
ncbi:MAG: hypothetical protein WBA93_13165 [Microcoleaceae cyanobacterium]